MRGLGRGSAPPPPAAFAPSLALGLSFMGRRAPALSATIGHSTSSPSPGRLTCNTRGSSRAAEAAVEGMPDMPPLALNAVCWFFIDTMAAPMSSSCDWSCRVVLTYSLRNSPKRRSNVSFVIHLLPATSCRAAADIITCTRLTDKAVVPPVSPVSSAEPSTLTCNRCASSMCCCPCSLMCSMSSLLMLISCFNCVSAWCKLWSSAPMDCSSPGPGGRFDAAATRVGLALPEREAPPARSSN
mmetsp:Transcript_103759/g.300094  ORF Transcript_103759/g.300094 Transcript_103759/m.300094 type:complete len:241 (+) Transcript_103759:100-822(+)